MKIGRRVHRLALATAALLACAAVATAQASAATISVNKPCYVNSLHQRASMIVTGSGFTPGASVQITSSDDTVAASGSVSSTGTISIPASAPAPPFSKPGQKSVTVTAEDLSTTATAITQALVAPLAVATRPARAKFTHKVTWFFSGFTPGKSIYAHYLRKHPVAKARFGKAKGACGLLKTRALLFPGGHPRHKRYEVQIDDSKRYSKHASPRIVTPLKTFPA